MRNLKRNGIEETGQRPEAGNCLGRDPMEGGERPRRAMNITGEITGKGASQARAAVRPPPSMENVTPGMNAKRPGRSKWGANESPARRRADWQQAECGTAADRLAPAKKAEEEWAGHPRTAHWGKSDPAKGLGRHPPGAARSAHKTRQT